MSSNPEAGPGVASIVVRALLYAVAITLVVLFAPDEGPQFIYMGF